MNISKSNIINAILIIIVALLGWLVVYQNNMIDKQITQIKTKNEEDNKHTSIVYEQKIETLKKTNKELYDSIKIYKDEIDYLVQFKYSKEYEVHDTIIQKDTVDQMENIKEYVYENEEKNDTLNYQLKIGSFTEPCWYSIKFKISEQFTIVNKQIDNINETTIAPSTNGSVSNVTVLKTKNKKTFKDRFAVGPSITAGYGIINNKFEVVVGASVTWDLW